MADTQGDSLAGEERNYPADVHVHREGRFVYLSNQGLDSIAIFGIDERDGRVELVGNQPGGGAWPRNFAIDPEGRLLLCANQYTDNVVPFWIDPATGLLTAAGPSPSNPRPASVSSPLDRELTRMSAGRAGWRPHRLGDSAAPGRTSPARSHLQSKGPKDHRLPGGRDPGGWTARSTPCTRHRGDHRNSAGWRSARGYPVLRNLPFRARP